jgi:hypothetical protein
MPVRVSDKQICIKFMLEEPNIFNMKSGLTLEGDSGEEVALWPFTSFCTSAKREVEDAL